MKPIDMGLPIAVALLATEPLLAATAPPICLGSPHSVSAYNTGVQFGHSLVQRVWQSVSDCSELASLAAIVRQNVNSYTLNGTSIWAICRYTGAVDGVYEELDAVWMGCNADCCLEGELVGSLGADVYCRLSRLLGGLTAPDAIVPRPVRTCNAFSDCCVSTYKNASRKECAEYTDGVFGDIWAESCAVQCAEP